ncbi:MAG: hypothetical protein JWM90_1417 [Thermoleophilia bacterium]|nr:hypothetical protein [Thermoleophilia bacterium]
MKPVNLIPIGAEPSAAVASGAKPNMGVIGGSIAGVVAVLAIAGYFAMARVDSVKSETNQFTTSATSATTETASVRSQIQSLGQPVTDTDTQLAEGAEKVLVSAYTERRDYVEMMRELMAAMEGTGGWYESIEASSIGGQTEPGVKSVTLKGYFPSKELLASFNERIEASRSLRGADTLEIKSTRKFSNDAKRKQGVYWGFTTTANLVDNEAPFVADPSAEGEKAGTDGTTVSDTTALTLSLGSLNAITATAKKPKAAATPVIPAAPKNPFDLAATAAAGGSTK